MIWSALKTDGTLLYGSDNPPAVGGDILGVWDYDGIPQGTPNATAYIALRPLSNDAGKATEDLLFTYVMGHAPRLLGNPQAVDRMERLYPATRQPLEIEIRHKLFTGNPNPAWDGWGWRAEIIGGAASRSPSARAIGIYSDAACTQYLYTTGAFTAQASEWYTGTVWATQYNPGLLGWDNDNKGDVHHACLLGAAKEGIATLRADRESVRHQFWAS